MRYSIEPRDRIYAKGYGFLSFAKNVAKNLSNKCGQKLLYSAKKFTTDAIKTASKEQLKTAEAIGDLIGNKIAVELASVSRKKSTKELANDETKKEDVEITTHKKRYISSEERQTIIDQSRLVPKSMYKLRYISPEERQQIID